MAPTVLVIEDETKLRHLVGDYLRREGFDVLTSGTGADGLNLAERTAPDVVVLDLRLPDIAGETVAREIRRFSSAPLLILSAKVSEADRINGFEAGADDYLTKPFSLRELALRLHAILRRNGASPGADGQSDVPSFGDGELRLDEHRREARVRGELVALTPTEWGLLSALTSHPGRVYTRTELINRVRGYEYEGYERTIDSHIRNLRRKIELEPQHPQILLTVLGGGYRMALARDVA